MPVILISYRRADSKETSGRIHEQLVSRYGKKSVYIDIDSIQPSADYRVHITQALERALVMVAVIGKDWAGPRAEGKPRIFDADDPVRAEVETAFANRRSVRIIRGAQVIYPKDLGAILIDVAAHLSNALRVVADWAERVHRHDDAGGGEQAAAGE